MVAEHGCSATPRVAWKLPRLPKKELDDDETNLIPTIDERRMLGEDVKNADQKLMTLSQTRQASDRDDSEIHVAGVKTRRIDRHVLNDLIDNAQAQLTTRVALCRTLPTVSLHSGDLWRRSRCRTTEPRSKRTV